MSDPIPPRLAERTADLLVERLAAFPTAVRAMVERLSPEEARWRPSEDDWSIVEILGHLLDEERSDFRDRLERLLRDPAEPWPPIDPVAAAAARNDRDRDLHEILAAFDKARSESVAWLCQRLAETPAMDWAVAKTHPKGDLSAGDLLASWAAHDLLHLRQIAKRLHGMLDTLGDPFTVGYAGTW
ncbi:MAG: DinB family protein [Phycisphaerales bacterium]|jgi:uncharacterized damage-inducible protein DinB